jgi:cysteinyl-tRNA synthetase
MAGPAKLRLYNTLTKAKEAFEPLDPSDVRMYVCGPTVYDFAHIGNARPVIVFDVLYRLLRHLYGPEHVTYVRNITDIDDKINKRAFERWTRKRPLLAEMRELTEGTAAQYEADVKALGCLPPTHAPRATEYVCDGAKPMDMVRVIEKLVARGVAYEAEGHLLFSPSAMNALAETSGIPQYGQLSRRPFDEMLAGARVDVAPYKRDPMDFVLWKPSDPETEPGWDSPWGFGRPGWHIECSAMSAALLGETFDIHAGGIDLVFPHHENEIAQSCCAFGIEKMASVWMHNGFLQVEGQKMSKSLGNFVTIRELMRGWRGEPWSGFVLRLEMLGTHYTQPIDWTPERLTVAKATLQAFSGATATRDFQSDNAYEAAWKAPPKPSKELLEALLDDLNTPLAVSTLKEKISRLLNAGDIERSQTVHDARFLGLADEEMRRWHTGSQGLSQMALSLLDKASLKFRDYRVANLNKDIEMISEINQWFRDNNIVVISPNSIQYIGVDATRGQIERLIDARLAARKAKDFATSDRIRDELLAMGIQLKDGKDPATGEPVTTWEVKR